MDADEFLEHYGKKGMRWGQRKNRGSVKTSKKTSSPKPRAKDLSDDDLKKAVNRMQMEKQYNSLIGNNSKKEAGAKFVKNVAGTAVKTALTAAVTYQVSSVLKKAKIVPDKK
jgi:hypothetical protein